LIDSAKKLGRPLERDWLDYIKPEYHAEFAQRYRKLYNFFKHADRDFDIELPVRDIVMSNVFGLFICAINYMRDFQDSTKHMGIIFNFTVTLLPQMIQPTGEQGYELLKNLQAMQTMTVGAFIDMLEEHAGEIPDYLAERNEDTQDLGHFYQLTFKELREGV